MATHPNTAATTQFEQPSDREVVFTRLLDAPVDLVWRMWSDIRHVHEWWGPTGFTTTTHEFNFVAGGAWRHVMHGPDGTDYPNRVVFLEIEPPRRIVYENSWDLPDTPIDFIAVVTFLPDGKKTKLSQRMTFRDTTSFKTAVEVYGVLAGGVQNMDRLAHYAETQ
ncbi:MAG: SRPBCC domain-containing protein [bacterium]